MAVNLTGLKASFFDSTEVLRMVDKRTVSALSKFGAFVCRRAQTSIKYKDGPAAPGSPPHAHKTSGFTRQKKNKKTGLVTQQSSSPLRDLLFFSYDREAKTVVVGPVPFRGKAVVPGLMERGGQGIEPRPFMKPALEAELPKFASFFRG